MVLNDFLDDNHNMIFSRVGAEKMNYAIAFIKTDSVKSFIQQWKECELRRSSNFPEPDITFCRKKKEACQVLQRNLYSAATWRLSPSLVWQL
jgi:hypothetical protein